ncbi:MAG: hypothetical protein QF475_03510 [Candidatus Undinarchaeales archaeon]|jgi:predicted amidophosphoribosyltransferase|nr:hypothetical protein [Candidatus Undinarchaeales archaeon]
MKNPKRFCSNCKKELSKDSKLEVCSSCFEEVAKGFTASTWKINKKK